LKFGKIIKEPLTQEDIYLQLLNETLPEKTFIREREIKEEFIPEAIKKPDLSKPQKLETDFTPIHGEVPKARPSKLNYSVIRNPGMFENIEINLKEDGLIDMDYNFIKSRKKQNNRKLAAIIKILIQKNYFKKNIYGLKGDVTPNLIREYLENRYNANVSQEFRKITNDQIQEFKDQYRWIDQLRTLS
jgi:hypothetical protein